MTFTHLHLHTEYSLLDGANRISDLAPRLKELGMDSCAITDHGNMFGIIDFYRAMKSAGIKPIIGCEVYVAPRKLTDKEGGYDRDPYHLILLAENNTGYHNLIKLVSASYLEGFYYHPRIDFDLLEKHHEGLIALSACLGGEVPRTYMLRGYDAAKEVALRYNAVFGDGNYFLELQANGIREQMEVNQGLIRMSRETGIPLVATNDCHYLKKEDARAHDVLICMQTRKTVHDEDRMRMESDQFYVKSPEEMAEAFADVPEAVENTAKIAARCNAEIEFGKLYLPEFVPEDGTDSKTYLNRVAHEGLDKRLNEINPAAPREDYVRRLEKELDVINSMGYTDYFLIVRDVVDFAHKNKIMVGPGRGSVGGSLVAYALRITNIDPLRYNLLFERFLNPDRVSMPDIDLDFCYERRGEMIDYVTEKYGEDHVCQVITFGTLAAKQALRDVARALGLPYAEADRIAKMVPNELNITIKDALAKNEDLRREYENDDNTRELIDLAMKFEGMPRNASTHAAGVIISGVPISDIAPLAETDRGVVVQFNKDIIEDVGLLKFDFLGLRTLTVIRDTVNMIKENHGISVDFDQMDFDDPAVYELLSDGKTDGVFQLESPGMTRFIKEMKPKNFEDIIAGISLFRPGPMEQIPRYICAQRSPETVQYDHELLEPILKNTYGCLIYQEQVMQTVRNLAGFSMGQADLVRRAMAKKKPDELARYKNLFIHGGDDGTGSVIEGAISHGVSEKTAEKIFHDVMAFAGYAFNKSHAAGYAVLAYQTAWLKAHYPVEFMAAMLNSFLGNLDKASHYVRACEEMRITVLPPDINRSYVRFTTENGAIRFALGAVKNVGTQMIAQVIAEREAEGPFKTFGDFMSRMSDKNLNKKVVESLIKSSALDTFGIDRSKLLAVHEDFAKNLETGRALRMDGQVSLFDFGEQPAKPKEPEYPDIKPDTLAGRLAQEKEMLGLYVSGHPLDEYAEAIRELTTGDSSLFMTMLDEPEDDSNLEIETGLTVRDREPLIMAGIIVAKRDLTTRKNERMAFVTLEDLKGTYEMIVFPKSYREYFPYLRDGEILLVAGNASVREDEEPKLIADRIAQLTPDMRALPEGMEAFRTPFAARGGNGNGRGDRRVYNTDQHMPSPVDAIACDNGMPAARPQSAVETAPLKLCINWDAFDEKAQRILKAQLDYSFGTTPVMLYHADREGESCLEVLPSGFDLQYLPALVKRFGEENIIVTE